MLSLLSLAYCPYIPSSCASMPQNQVLKSPHLLVNQFRKITEHTTAVPDQSISETDLDNQEPNELPTASIVESDTNMKTLTDTKNATFPNEPTLSPGNEKPEHISSPIIANSRHVFRGDIDVFNMTINQTDENDDELIKEEKILLPLPPNVPVVPVTQEEKVIDEVLSLSDIETLVENDNTLVGEDMRINKRMSDDNNTNTLVEEDSGSNYIIRALADKLTGEIVGDGIGYEFITKGAQLLNKTIEMFKQLAPKEIIQDSMVDEVFRTFVSSHMFGIGYVASHDNDITDEMFHQILHGLSLCQNRDEGFSEYLFESDTSCPPTIQKFINTKTKKAFSVSELQSKLPETFKYTPEKDNFVVGLMWKMVDAIHAECFGTWLKYDGSIPIFYWSFMEHFFLQDDVINLFENESTGTSKYERVIESDKPLKDVAFNVDTILSAIHSKSPYPDFFSKPSPKDLNADKADEDKDDGKTDDKDEKDKTDEDDDESKEKGSGEQPDSKTGEGSDSTETKSSEEKGPSGTDTEEEDDDDGFIVIGSRAKRSLTELSPEAFEIWDGKAYCLQKLDSSLPPSVENTLPLLSQVCHI